MLRHNDPFYSIPSGSSQCFAEVWAFSGTLRSEASISTYEFEVGPATDGFNSLIRVLYAVGLAKDCFLSKLVTVTELSSASHVLKVKVRLEIH